MMSDIRVATFELLKMNGEMGGEEEGEEMTKVEEDNEETVGEKMGG